MGQCSKARRHTAKSGRSRACPMHAATAAGPRKCCPAFSVLLSPSPPSLSLSRTPLPRIPRNPSSPSPQQTWWRRRARAACPPSPPAAQHSAAAGGKWEWAGRMRARGTVLKPARYLGCKGARSACRRRTAAPPVHLPPTPLTRCSQRSKHEANRRHPSSFKPSAPRGTSQARLRLALWGGTGVKGSRAQASTPLVRLSQC